MKKIVLIAGIVLFGMNVNAQDKGKGLQGTWWVAGEISSSTSTTGNAKSSDNMILPIAGYFIAPSTTIGLGVGVINSKVDNGVTTTKDVATTVIKPLIRKYWNVSGNLFFYGQAALPITMGKDNISNGKTSSFALEVAPGFDYVINKWLTVESSFTVFNVGQTTETPQTGDKTTKFYFGANPMNSVADRTLGSLQLGIKFLF